MVVNSLVQALELENDITLRELAFSLPAPWPTVFTSHRDALVSDNPGTLPRSLVDFLR